MWLWNLGHKRLKPDQARAPLATLLDRQPASEGRPLDPALRDTILLIAILVAFLEATAQQLRPVQPPVVMPFSGIGG